MSRARATWMLAGTFLILLPAVTPRIYASDEVQYFAYLRSLWFDGDLSFENEYRYFYDRGIARADGFHETFLERTTETGRRINFGTIGCAVLWSPFYAAADLLVRATGGLGAGWAADGFSQPYIAAVSYASALYGFLALVLSAHVAKRWFGTDPWPPVWVWFGTPLLFYMYIAPPMSHACSAFAVALFTATWLRVRERWSARGLVLLAALAALMAMVREQDAFFVAGPALDFADTWVRRARGHPVRQAPGAARLLTNAAAGVLAGVVSYLPQALAYLALNGYVGPSRLVARKMTWWGPHVLDVLVSPSHGFFAWTPLALLAIAGLVLALRGRPQDLRWVAACLLLMLALQVYVAGSVESWTVAGAFGQRRFVAVTVILVVGLASLRAALRTRPGRLATAVAAVACAWWNVGLMVQFGAGLMDRQRLEPARTAYVTFVVLPRLAPGLAYRYLFERNSFYRPAAER